MATRESTRNEFPFMVSILFDNYSRGLGVLISPRCVVTSTSSIIGSSYADLTFGAHTIPLTGVPDPGTEPASVTVRTQDFYINPSWIASSLDNNLAVILLPYDLPLSPAIQPINVVDWTEDWAGQSVKGVGWGLHLQNNVLRHTSTPQVVDVSIVEMQQAITAFEKPYNQSTQVAAQGTDSTTSVLVTTGSDGTKLVGFLNEGMDSGGLAVYSRFDRFSPWIEQNSGVSFQ